MSKKQTTILFILVVTMLLAIIVAACIYVIRNDNRLKNLESLLSKQPKIVQPVDGKNGYTPIKGVDYFDGTNGKDGKDSHSTHTIEKQTIVENNIKEVIKEIPIKGAEGKKGNDGLTQQLLVDINTCYLMSKYTNDDSWLPLAQLPKPCKVE